MIRPTHVVVPIYRDIQLTQRCLETLDASRLPPDCRITLIDDASPETGMTELLAPFAQRRGWTVLRNPTNLGFVVSANLGMERHPDHDVVLLNNDTEVPPCWLQRLRQAAYRDANTGTVTPFTNAGSLASYPLPNRENPLPPGSSLEELDRIFQEANAGMAIDLPTGVGFCMFIRRDCIENTGTFDAAGFGKGYGEENDFCLRASARGWKHVLAADCFVFHRGRSSFGAEKDERVRRAYTLLVARYPHYPALIQRHVAADPARPCRLSVDLLRLARGGGATALRLDRRGAGNFELRWTAPGEAFALWFSLPQEIDTLGEVMSLAGARGLAGLPDGMKQSLHDIPGNPPGRERLLQIAAIHGTPRVTPLQALGRIIAGTGLRLSDTRLLRPFVHVVPPGARARLRGWLRSGRS